jgi:hypothetical protein
MCFSSHSVQCVYWKISEIIVWPRQSRTDYVRTSLAERQIAFSDDQWERVAKPSLWQYLVHEEFRVLDVNPFEVVRVTEQRSDHCSGHALRAYRRAMARRDTCLQGALLWL